MRRVTSLLAGTVLLTAMTFAGSQSSATTSGSVTLPPIPAISGLPIPSLPTDLFAPRFVGSAATAQPIEHPPIPQSPWLSPDGTNTMHNDAYASDAYRVSGPLGRNLRVTSASYGIRECATIAFDSRGRIVGLCGGLEGFAMMVIDPVTLRPVSELRTSARNLATSANPFTDICGGTYFFLDADDVAYPTTGEKTVQKIRVQADGSLVKEQEWSLAEHLAADDCLIATMPDWDGRLWFFSQAGRVGTLDRATGTVQVMQLPEGEEVTNSVSTDETGGMYVVSTHALYRLDATAEGLPEVTWREVYDRGSIQKPGNLSQGSGTTPTLLGDRWVAINDNADPQTNILVYDRRAGVSDRLHCTQPVLTSGASTTENSLVAAGNSFIIENNYGYGGPTTTILGKTSTPGLARVMVEDDGCRVAWTNSSIAPSSVPKASLGNGLLYAYTKPKLPSMLGNAVDAWYFTAIDIRTGKTVWSRLMGTGIQWNNHYAAIYLGPDGTAYIATLAGLIRIQDS
ncbi:hypothetical protein HMPREF0063_12510 [Aeromicrobium marinum DSM 15272]|uniref:PQQ enzyme repeat protein n=1 Tax=Aeromicrobium marinum DSM 15272 TaxID=585531 RepID=E2SEQ1_9ACTN|nr:hypothetical protein [Aeromicrobium marinum]EFQ82348.1 hypothetical protein HMPREF0063_12510 [Aeromicrobium marinum DSM 15272]